MVGLTKEQNIAGTRNNDTQEKDTLILVEDYR